MDFLTKKQKVNEGEVPHYYVEESHPAIIDPEEFDLVQAEITRRKVLGKVYSSSNIFSAKIMCSCCGGYFGSKVWHSTSKYRRVIWQCNHKFSSHERCKTPHLYEEEIKRKFITVCGMVGECKEEFFASCREIIPVLSDCSALDQKINERYDRLNYITRDMQEFIRFNAMKPQKDGTYEAKMAEYETEKSEAEKRLHELILLKKELLSRKELLEGMAAEIKKNGITVSEFDEKLWRLMVEKVVVEVDGTLTFMLRNGMEVIA